MLGQLDRCFHGDVAIQVAWEARTKTFETFATQTELLLSLGAFWNVNRRLAAKCGHANLAAQRGCRDADGHGAMQVVSIALEDVVFLDANFDE